jgi:hypothetical protein
VAPKFRGLWHRRAKKIAKIGSLRDHREPRIEFSHGLREHACGGPEAEMRCGRPSALAIHADPGLASVRGLDWLGPDQRHGKGPSMSIELADAELVMLSAAARRDDRRLIPAPKPSCLRSTFLW